MNISELSTTESRQLLLVHSRLHYDRMDNVANMLKLIRTKGYFQSEAGKCYSNALEEYLNGKTPIDCIYCAEPLSDEDTLICSTCSNELFERVNTENKEIQRERAEFKRAEAEAAKVSSELKAESVSDSEEIYEYAQSSADNILNTSTEDVYLSGRVIKDNNPGDRKDKSSYIIGILITCVIVALMALLCVLRIHFGSLTLVNSKHEQSVYDTQTTDEPIEVNESASKEMFISADPSDAASGDEVLISDDAVATGNEDADSSLEITMDDYADDGFMLLGDTVDVADAKYGESKQVVGDNSKYYPSCGISLLFSEKTGVIVYMDNDGTGSGEIEVPIFGILPGDDIGVVRDNITNNGIAIIDVGGDSFMCRFSPVQDENTVYELDVTHKNGSVAIVSAMLLE